MRVSVTLVVGLLCASPGWALVGDEPGACAPPCRSGFTCQAGTCVSLCNPACPAGERCINGDCEPIARPGSPARFNYVAILGVYHAALSNSASHVGEPRIELGGRFASFQIGPTFGSQIIGLRGAILGHLPFQPLRHKPFFLVPTVSLGYSFAWVSGLPDMHRQDLFVAPGLRVRYDISSRIALLLDLLQVQITFLRLESGPKLDLSRVAVVPVTWNLAAGFALLY
jgi:hypothetical protein